MVSHYRHQMTMEQHLRMQKNPRSLAATAKHFRQRGRIVLSSRTLEEHPILLCATTQRDLTRLRMKGQTGKSIECIRRSRRSDQAEAERLPMQSQTIHQSLLHILLFFEQLRFLTLDARPSVSVFVCLDFSVQRLISYSSFMCFSFLLGKGAVGKCPFLFPFLFFSQSSQKDQIQIERENGAAESTTACTDTQTRGQRRVYVACGPARCPCPPFSLLHHMMPPAVLQVD